MKPGRYLQFCIALLLTALSSPAAGDGGYASSRYLGALSSDQRALIVLERDRITIAYSTAYTGDGSEFGWIIPVPGLPGTGDVFEPPDGEMLFESLDEATQPHWTTRRKLAGSFGSGIVGSAESEDGVTVYENVIMDSYEASVLGAATGTSLLAWLDENGYRINDSSEGILNDYIIEGWNFVAVRMGFQETEYFEQEFLPPLAIRYSIPYSRDLVDFPMRISGISTTGEARVSLFVVTDSSVSSSNYRTVNISQNPGDRSARRTNEYLERLIKESIGAGQRGVVRLWAGECPGYLLADLRSSDLLNYVRSPYLTRLETVIRPSASTPDIRIIPDAVPETFTVRLRYRQDPPTLEEIGIALLVILFLAPLLLRLFSFAAALIFVPLSLIIRWPRPDAQAIVLCHRSGFMGFAGPLLVMLTRGQRSAVIREQCRRSLNFQLSMAVYLAVIVSATVGLSLIDLRIIILPFLLMELLLVLAVIYYWVHFTVAFIVTLVGVRKAGKKKEFKYPLTIEFFKESGDTDSETPSL